MGKGHTLEERMCPAIFESLESAESKGTFSLSVGAELMDSILAALRALSRLKCARNDEKNGRSLQESGQRVRRRLNCARKLEQKSRGAYGPGPWGWDVGHFRIKKKIQTQTFLKRCYPQP